MPNRAIATLLLFITAPWNLAAEPVVFRVSDPIEPGQTALLFGDGILGGVQAYGLRLQDEKVRRPPSGIVDAPEIGDEELQVLDASDLSAKVLLPDRWKPGAYAIRLENGGGLSAPVYLNRTEPWWWLGGPEGRAVPGEEVRVFGKNLGPKTRAWLARESGARELEREGAARYAARFRVPADLAAGTYELWVHNGYGGRWGFGEPLSVPVENREPWPEVVYEVTAFGAVGDGEADDTQAFRAALAQAAAQGGGVVHVARGTYKITGKLTVPPRTVLRGEKREWVWLYAPVNQPEFDAVIAGNGDFAVEELSIVSQTARRLVACPDHLATYAGPSGNVPPEEEMGRNVRLSRLRLHHLRYAHRVAASDPRRLEGAGPTTVFLAGPDMVLEDSEIISSGKAFLLANSRRCRVEGNRLETGRNGGYIFASVQESVFADNDIRAADLEGTYGGTSGTSYRLHIADNYWHDAYGQEREALTFDTPYFHVWRGRVGRVDGRRFTTAARRWTPGELAGKACVVAYGKGLGQLIPVVDNTAEEVMLARPFAIEPDETSYLLLTVNKSDVVIADNRFADASVAAQLYGQTYGFIVDGNRAERTGGSYAIGRDHDKQPRRTYSTASFHQWLNNEFSEGFVYQQGAFLHGILGPCVAASTLAPPMVMAIGNVLRGNRVRDQFTVGALFWGKHPFAWPVSAAGYSGRDTIIEENEILDTALGIDVNPLYLDTFIRNNRIERSPVPVRDDGIDTWIHPAERFAHQLQAVEETLPATADLDGYALGAAALAEKAQSPQLQAQYLELLSGLWAEVAQAQPLTRPETLANLVGLRYEINGVSSSLRDLLVAGVGGTGRVVVRVRTQPWSPAIAVQVQVEPGPGWQALEPAPSVQLPPGRIDTLTAVAVAPVGARDKEVRLRVTAILAGESVTFEDVLRADRWKINEWAVIGPFANSSGQVPDPAGHGPGRQPALNRRYQGVGGEVMWRPVTATPLDLAALLNRDGNGTAYALSCMQADDQLDVVLRMRFRGGVELWLGDQYLGAGNAPVGTMGEKDVPVRLAPGSNVLICKTSFLKGDWELEVTVEEPASSSMRLVKSVPAHALWEMEAFLPSVPRAGLRAQTGLEHDAELRWVEVYADEFSGEKLSSRWRVVKGSFQVEGGVLAAGSASFLVLDEKVRAPMRIEYDARSPDPWDLSALWNPEPAILDAGHLFSFAAGPAGSRLQVEGQVVAQDFSPRAKGKAGKWHHVIVQILKDGSVELYADGRLLLEHRQGSPPATAGFPGVWTFGTGAQFDNLRIYAGE